MVIEDFNTLVSKTDRTRQKISKDIEELNSMINLQDLTDVYRTHQSTTAEYTFFSHIHGSYTKINQISTRKITGKSPNSWKLIKI